MVKQLYSIFGGDITLYYSWGLANYLAMCYTLLDQHKSSLKFPADLRDSYIIDVKYHMPCKKSRNSSNHGQVNPGEGHILFNSIISYSSSLL